MAYRNDLDALEARHAALSAEVEDRTRERDEAARMLDEARAREEQREIDADIAAGGPARRRRQMILIGTGVAVAIALVIGIAYAARGMSPEERTELIYARYAKFTDELCACTTAACGNDVMQRVNTWAASVEKGKPPSPRYEDVQRFSKLGERLGDCFAKLREVERFNAEQMNPYSSQQGGN